MSAADSDRVRQSAQFFSEGKFEQAEKILRGLLEEKPCSEDELQILVLLGLCSQGQRKPKRALDYFERAVQADQYSPVAHFYLGRILAELDQPDRARDALAQALTLDPNNVEARTIMGLISMRGGDLDRAANELRTALRANADSVPALSGLARVLAMQDQLDEAEQLASKAVRLNPKHAGAQDAMAFVFIKQGQTAFAEQCLRNALEIQPNSGELHSGLASVLYHQGRDQEALPHFQQALARGFGGARTAINASVSLARSGDHQQAWQLLEQSLQRWPEDGDLRLTLAEYRLRAGQGESAQELIAELDPSRFDVRMIQTRIHQALGRKAEAVALLDTIIGEAQPDEERFARLLKLDIAGLENDLEAAQAAAAPLLNKRPPDAEAVKAWAQACHRMHKLDLALEPVERLLSESAFDDSTGSLSDQARLHQMLAEMKHRLGQHDAALTHLGRTAWRPIPVAEMLNRQQENDLLALWQHDVFDVSALKAPDDGWPAPVIAAGWPGSGREMILAALMEAADQITVFDPAANESRREALGIPLTPETMRNLAEGKQLAARKRYYRGLDRQFIQPVVLDTAWYEMSAVPALAWHFPGLTVIWPEIDPRDLELHFRFCGYRDVSLLRDLLAQEQELAKKLSRLLPVRVIPVNRQDLFDAPESVTEALANELKIEAVPAMQSRLEMVRDSEGFLPGQEWRNYQPLFEFRQIYDK